MKCWHCGAEEEDPPMGKLAFRDTCEQCGAWLRCCRNCRYYVPGLPNDCAVPGTEYIADREASNFCEEFALLGKGPDTTSDPNEAAKRLFGKEETEPPKKGFDSLFDD